MFIKNNDFAAFRAKLLANGGIYETRDAPDFTKLAETIDKIGTTFEEYKATNDKRLAEIKATGAADPVTEAKLAKLDAELDGLGDIKKRLDAVELRANRPGGAGDRKETETQEASDYKSAWLDWVRAPRDQAREARVHQAVKALETRARAGGDLERRAAQVVTSTGSAGGFALPEQIATMIDRLVAEISPIREIARVVTVGTPDYKELIDVGGAAFEWVGEGGARSQTNTPDLAEIAPTFGTASARPRASEESLDDLFFNVESWLIESAAEAIAAGEGAAFVSGTGVNRPTGFLAGPAPVVTGDPARAFGTLQYVPSLVAGAMPANPDPLVDMVYALRARYRANARWVAAKSVLATMRKYKDTTGQYLWQPSLAAGQPEAFMGYGVTEAEDMPAVAANSFSVAFGDFNQGYLIADRVGLRMTRDEITLPGFVQFYIRKRVGGRLRNTQAIKLLRCSVA